MLQNSWFIALIVSIIGTIIGGFIFRFIIRKITRIMINRRSSSIITDISTQKTDYDFYLELYLASQDWGKISGVIVAWIVGSSFIFGEAQSLSLIIINSGFIIPVYTIITSAIWPIIPLLTAGFTLFVHSLQFLLFYILYTGNLYNSELHTYWVDDLKGFFKKATPIEVFFPLIVVVLNIILVLIVSRKCYKRKQEEIKKTFKRTK